MLPVVVLNCRCGSVHQPAQQRDFVAVRGRRLLLGFENHRELGHDWVVDQSREKRVGQAIVDAEEKGSEIKELYRLNAECELRTLQMFAEKWKRLAAQMADSMPKGEGEKYAAFADHLAALLGRESTAFFGDDPPSAEEMLFDPKKRIERYVAEESDTGFNLDDVLNPKQELDLEKLCRELGLMDEE